MAVSECVSCKREFTGVGPFDAHQEWDWEIVPPKLTCLEPSSIGMVKDAEGRWGGGSVYVPAAERPTHEYDVECAKCGKVFQRPRKRGRPPTKCPKCRG